MSLQNAEIPPRQVSPFLVWLKRWRRATSSPDITGLCPKVTVTREGKEGTAEFPGRQ
jgi:hypothetical protein